MSDPFTKDIAKSLIERILLRVQKELILGSILKQLLDTDNHPIKLGKLNCTYQKDLLDATSRLYRINGLMLRVDISRTNGYFYDYTAYRLVRFNTDSRSNYTVTISVLHESLIATYGIRNHDNFNLKFQSNVEFDCEEFGMDLAMLEELLFQAVKAKESEHIHLFEMRCAEMEKIVKSLSVYIRN